MNSSVRSGKCESKKLKLINIARDDRDAIDESNIVDGRTRGATKKAGTYAEPGDEGLPGAEDGTSALRK